LSRLLPEFLVPCRNPKAKFPWKKPRGLFSLAPHSVSPRGWPIDRSVAASNAFQGGNREAQRLLNQFVRSKLASYSELRNHPEDDGTSRLSPYLHFGHIGPNTVALAIEKANAPSATKEAFLDQLITWRELAVNFV